MATNFVSKLSILVLVAGVCVANYPQSKYFIVLDGVPKFGPIGPLFFGLDICCHIAQILGQSGPILFV